MLRRALLVVMLMFSFVGVTATPAYAPEWCPSSMISSDFVFLANANYLAVSAEISWTGNSYGQLRARGQTLGPWERFRLVCDQGPDVYAIRSVANGRYVTAEISWTGDQNGLLRARATSIGSWERFRIPATSPSGGGFTILSLANNRYVTAEVGRSGELRARATTVGAWERYTFYAS